MSRREKKFLASSKFAMDVGTDMKGHCYFYYKLSKVGYAFHFLSWYLWPTSRHVVIQGICKAFFLPQIYIQGFVSGTVSVMVSTLDST